MTKSISIIFSTLLFLLLFNSCLDEDFTEDNTYKVHFSTDTICFDTLFSETPSYTRTFLLKNPNKEAIKFSSVRLGGGASSNFRFNVDGKMPNDANVLNDVVVYEEDSIFVFVETTVPKDADSINIFTTDSLMFFYNGNVSQVQLQAVGKNAKFLKNYSVADGETFTGDKPYLVMGYLHVPESSTLTIDAGTQLYLHANSHIIVDGNIQMKGTLEQAIDIRGTRMDNVDDADDTPYANLPSQWGNIYLQNPNGNHLFEYTNIRGASMGILLVGAARANPQLTVKNCVFHTFGGYGLYSQNGIVTIENTEISNCGVSCVYVLGGELYMVHSTIANYFKYASRTTPACCIANYAQQGLNTQYFPVQSAVIENSIIFGSHSEEIQLNKDEEKNTLFNVLVSNNLLKSKKIESVEYVDNIWSKSQNGAGSDTVFVSTYSDKEVYYNFQLDSLSHAISKANRVISSRYPLDLRGKSRLEDDSPDLGAYEK